MIAVYHTYASHFSGCFDRSDPSYWEKWVQAESPLMIVAVDSTSGKIIGLFAAEHRKTKGGEVPSEPIRLRLKDFAINEEVWAKNRGQDLFVKMVHFWLATFGGVLDPRDYPVSINLPSSICGGWDGTILESLSPFFIDQGVMYHTVTPSEPKAEDLVGQTNHLFFATDSF
jgi:hypothetical protein